MIDDIVKLSFEEGEAVVTGKPRISKRLADTLRRGGIDYYLGFLLKDTDEETGGETYYAGFCTARIREEEGRTYFVPMSVRGTGSWALYAGVADRMRRARVRRSSDAFLDGYHNFAFELGGASYELAVPHSRGKSATLLPKGKMRRELEPLLTFFEARDRAISAYHAGKAAQQIERANEGAQARPDEGLVQIVRETGCLEITGLPLHYHPYSLAARPETGTHYLVAEAVVPRQKQEKRPNPNPYKLFVGRAEHLEEVEGMRARELSEPGWSSADTFSFYHEGHPVTLVIEQYHADNRAPLKSWLRHYTAEGDSTPASVQPLKLLLSQNDISQQTSRHFELSHQTGSPDPPVFRYSVRL